MPLALTRSGAELLVIVKGAIGVGRTLACFRGASEGCIFGDLDRLLRSAASHYCSRPNRIRSRAERLLFNA
jgi:hypothetical protein